MTATKETSTRGFANRAEVVESPVDRLPWWFIEKPLSADEKRSLSLLSGSIRNHLPKFIDDDTPGFMRLAAGVLALGVYSHRATGKFYGVTEPDVNPPKCETIWHQWLGIESNATWLLTEQEERQSTWEFTDADIEKEEASAKQARRYVLQQQVRKFNEAQKRQTSRRTHKGCGSAEMESKIRASCERKFGQRLSDKQWKFVKTLTDAEWRYVLTGE